MTRVAEPVAEAALYQPPKHRHRPEENLDVNVQPQMRGAYLARLCVGGGKEKRFS